LIAAQECLPNNEQRDKFAADFIVLTKAWEAISPDARLSGYAKDYKWLSLVYESIKPPSGRGKLLWHTLGAKTIELVHENITLDTIDDDLETLVLDGDILEGLVKTLDATKKGKEIEIKLIARFRKHKGNPTFEALGERLERIKEQHEQGLMNSIAYLKALLELAKDTVEAEQKVETRDEIDKGKAALTELFAESRNENTPIIVERIVNDIDEIVRLVRFPDWQYTTAGERSLFINDRM
jgi:type I restriction enzyme R subunit